jgi:hypothetical protein
MPAPGKNLQNLPMARVSSSGRMIYCIKGKEGCLFSENLLIKKPVLANSNKLTF